MNYCTCRIQTGSERNKRGQRVCETCGKPDRITIVYAPTPENVECQTCDGLGQVRDYCSSELCDDPHCTLVSLHCPDCTPENVEEPK